jgi:type I restriction enzyme, R subunit
MEYDHARAVADGVNVDFEVYNIRTKITAQGATVEAQPDTMLGYRDRQTRALRWETPDEDLSYDPNELDRRVVAKDQIRTIIRTFRDRLPVDIFPGRKEVPKTLIFAKDDSHAEDIVEIVRDEFGRGNAFCQKITYKVTAANPRDLIQAFRNQYEPRIAVTVDMVATGTDIKPIEIVMFMRAVKSRVLFEQMKGRGVRIIDPNDLRAVSGADAVAKTHFVIVDCVGMTETELADTQPLDRKRTVSLQALLEHVAMGGTDAEVLSSLASRLARLDKQCGPEEHARVAQASGGLTLAHICGAIVDGLDPDRQIAEAGRAFDVPEGEEPTAPQVKQAAEALLKRATEPLATRPALRTLLQDLKREMEQVIDEVSEDELLEAGASEEAREKARALVADFERFIEDNKDEIDALQFFYAQPSPRVAPESRAAVGADEPWHAGADSLWTLTPPLQRLHYVSVFSNPADSFGYRDLAQVREGIRRSLDRLSLCLDIRAVAMIHIPTAAAGDRPSATEDLASADAMIQAITDWARDNPGRIEEVVLVDIKDDFSNLIPPGGRAV